MKLNLVSLQQDDRRTYARLHLSASVLVLHEHNHLWNGGNGWGTVKLFEKENGELILVDEVEATHIGCEYGEYDHSEAY